MITATDIVEYFNKPIIEIEEGIIPPKKGWRCIDYDSCEVECGDFLWGLVRYLKPDIIVETGTSRGFASACMASALHANGRGHLWTVEIDEEKVKNSRKVFEDIGVSKHITVVHADSLYDEVLKLLPGKIDLLLIDGGNRISEYEKYSKFLDPNTGLVLWHDALKFEEIHCTVKNLGGNFIWAGRGLGITK